MTTMDDLSTASQCVEGARQALARVLHTHIHNDESLCRVTLAIDHRLRDQEATLHSLINWRRELER